MKRAILRIAVDAYNKEQIGYEMNCLISEEFSPSPDYSYTLNKVRKACKQTGITYPEFMGWLNTNSRINDNFCTDSFNMHLQFYQILLEAENNELLRPGRIYK